MPKEERQYNIEQIEVAVLILALDTTSRQGSLAVMRGSDVIGELTGDHALTHAERLPRDFARVCERAGVALGDIELFAVAAGPGSFTGLRVGIAAIQGLAFGLDRRVVAVSTLEAVTAAAPSGPGRIAAWVDAQRGEVFAQLAGGVTPPLVAAPEAVLDAWREDTRLDSLVFHGDGAVRYADRIRAAAGPAARIAIEAPPLAAAIGRIAASAPERAVLPHAIVPIYVRRPDAELARDRRNTPA